MATELTKKQKIMYGLGAAGAAILIVALILCLLPSSKDLSSSKIAELAEDSEAMKAFIEDKEKLKIDSGKLETEIDAIAEEDKKAKLKETLGQIMAAKAVVEGTAQAPETQVAETQSSTGGSWFGRPSWTKMDYWQRK